MSVTGITKDPDVYAANNGLRIQLPEDRQLQLDIDSPKLPEAFAEQLYILSQMNRVVKEETTVSRSGNLHVYITLERDITPIERILFQACLCSDIRRELLTYQNTLDPNNKRPQFLFEKEQA